MTKPITLQSIIIFQQKKLKQAKRNQNETVVYAEKMILEILCEHERMIQNFEGNVVIHMSPERFKMIENIRPSGVLLDEQSD